MSLGLGEALLEKKVRRYRGDGSAESKLQGFEDFCKKEIRIDGPSGAGLVHFEFRDAQRETAHAYITESRTIILKARQIGFTTLTLLYCLWLALFFPNVRIIVLSKTERDAKKAMDKAIKAYNLLDAKLRAYLPQRKEKNVLRMSFDNGSWIEVHPAADNPARGTTVDLLVLDELAFMPNPDDAWASVLPTFADGGRVIALSTANGFGNLYQELWAAAELGESGFKPIFYPWSAVPDRDENWYEQQRREMESWQLAQEYPSNPEEAFVKSGNPVFDIEKLRSIKTRDGSRLSFFVEDERFMRQFKVFESTSGPLLVYDKPERGGSYVVGGDVAQGLGHGDFSAAHVIRVPYTDDQGIFHPPYVCAVWHGKQDPDDFGMELARLGWWYNTALIGPESNSFGLATVKALQHKAKYPRIYRQHRYTSRRESKTDELGWYTSRTTKPKMIADLAATIREGTLGLWDKGTIGEMMQYVRDEKGGMNGSPFDDRVMSLGIAVQMLQHVNAPMQKAELPPDQVEGTFEWEMARVRKDSKKDEVWVLGKRNHREPMRDLLNIR